MWELIISKLFIPKGRLSHGHVFSILSIKLFQPSTDHRCIRQVKESLFSMRRHSLLLATRHSCGKRQLNWHIHFLQLLKSPYSFNSCTMLHSPWNKPSSFRRQGVTVSFWLLFQFFSHFLPLPPNLSPAWFPVAHSFPAPSSHTSHNSSCSEKSKIWRCD